MQKECNSVAPRSIEERSAQRGFSIAGHVNEARERLASRSLPQEFESAIAHGFSVNDLCDI